MSDTDKNADKRILDGLKDGDPEKWSRAWDKARAKEEQSEAWIRDRINKAPKSER